MILNKIRYKNFFSSGNHFIEIDIRKFSKSLLTGKNGEGKSTLGNAVTFCLFGKTIKNVTKPQIVNSINNKNCLVECELEVNGSHYLVRRGIKPNVFEIYKDSELVDQTLVNDYQTYLEDKVMGCSYRTFLQTSIISIENYTPFMSLPKPARREFIEDILDIKVFTVMNQLVKNQNSKNKEELKLLTLTYNGIKEKVTLQKSHIDKLEEMTRAGLDTIDSKISEYQQELDNLSNLFIDSTTVKKEFETKRVSLKEAVRQYNNLQSEINVILAKIKVHKTDISFFDDKDSCPVCKQGLEVPHVHNIISTTNNNISELLGTIDTLKEQQASFANASTELDTLYDEEHTYSTRLDTHTSTVARVTKNLGEAQLSRARYIATNDISTHKAKLKELAQEGLDVKSRMNEIGSEQEYNAVMIELFKDSGIKSKIVEQYVPVINKLVNQYLEKFDFFVSFNLDCEFNETIKSRHRDVFTYSSFSAGERQRIDLALMFTLRQLAKMKNSFSCNLLLLDELLDASLDSDSLDNLIRIFSDAEFKSTNLMVISHSNKDKFEEFFDGSYEFYKRDGFSVVNQL